MYLGFGMAGMAGLAWLGWLGWACSPDFVFTILIEITSGERVVCFYKEMSSISCVLKHLIC